MNINKENLYFAMNNYFMQHGRKSEVDLYVQTSDNGRTFSIVDSNEKKSNATTVKVSGLIIKNFIESDAALSDVIKNKARMVYSNISKSKKFKYTFENENILIKNLDKRVRGKPVTIFEKIKNFFKTGNQPYTTTHIPVDSGRSNSPINRASTQEVSSDIYPKGFTEGQKAGFEAMAKINKDSDNGLTLDEKDLRARSASFYEEANKSIDIFQENLKGLYTMITNRALIK